MCFRGRFLSELCLILESFLELFWDTFCNLLVHCAEMCIFRKSSPLSAFCLVFEVLASRRGVFFSYFFLLFDFRFLVRFSTSFFIDFGSLLGSFMGSKLWKNEVEKLFKKRYPPSRKLPTITRPGGSWRPRLACAFFEQETMIRATAEALIGIFAEKVDWVRNRCTKNWLGCWKS